TKKKKRDYGLYFRCGKSRLGDFGHLSVASFSDSRYRGVGVKKLIRKAFSELNEVAPERLVIDLRGNTGGNLAYVTEIYSYLTEAPFRVVTNFESYSPMARSKNLWNGLGRFLVAGVRKRGDRYYRPGVLRQIKPKPESRRYRGRVLVMIDEYTFSAAAMLAHLVQSNGRGELVGADSGNSTTATFGGFFEVFPLYEGRMSLRIPAYRIDLAKPAPGFLTPDYPVHFSGEHIREGRDPQVEKLLELFGEKKP
ncbi:MAG: S41 family peptidase, partial [Bacteroidota bacterium]